MGVSWGRGLPGASALHLRMSGVEPRAGSPGQPARLLRLQKLRKLIIVLASHVLCISPCGSSLSISLLLPPLS